MRPPETDRGREIFMLKRLAAAAIATTLGAGLAVPTIAQAADDDHRVEELLEALGFDPADFTEEELADLIERVQKLIDEGVIDEDALDELAEMEPDEKDETVDERVDNSMGLTHAMIRYLADKGIETTEGELRDTLIEFLAAEGVDVSAFAEDGDGGSLRKVFVEYLEEVEGIEVEHGRLREALVENGWGPTSEEAVARQLEREDRHAERAERRAEREAEHAERREEREERAAERDERKEEREEEREARVGDKRGGPNADAGAEDDDGTDG
jgi:hypothetical protein